jgi:hypothetical protein
MDRMATTSRRFARAPRGLAGLLAIILVVEAFVGGRDPAYTAHAIDIWTDAHEQASGPEVRSSALLCFGDSQIQQGLLAPVVGQRLGAPVYNLAVPAGQPAAAYALLRRALGAGARPRAVAVGFFPGMLATDMRINVRTWPEVLGPIEALDLAFEGRSPDLAASTLLGLAFPSYRARAEVRGSIAAALQGEADRPREEVAARRRTRHANRGSLALGTNPWFTDEPGPPGPPPPPGLVWSPAPANEAYLRRFLDLAAQHGLVVYWVAAPVSPMERALRERKGIVEGFDRFLRRLQGEFPNLVVIAAQSIGFDRTHFGDAYHLNGPSAAVLSRSVGDAIAAGPPSSGRWVALPPHSVGPRLARDADRDGARVAK